MEDWYDPTYYGHSPAQDPAGPDAGQERVLRGGSWVDEGMMVRVSERFSIAPTKSSSSYGFRCVGDCIDDSENCPSAEQPTGPSSGELVWTGVVNGLKLVTIDRDQVDVGSLQGSLPGVVCVIQPEDEKRVNIVSTPGPDNNFNRLVFRVKGKGSRRVVIKWSLQ